MKAAMTFDLITLLPGSVESVLQAGVLGIAIRNGLLKVNVRSLREYGIGRNKVCDDTPCGGGEGLVLKPEPIAACFDAINRGKNSRAIYLTPQGKPFDDACARRLAGYKHIILLCGRYEGVDERAIERDIDEEISIGDYVLSGGELGALVLLDAVARFVPGVLGNESSSANDSFSDNLLEGPVYTKPRTFENRDVPDVLLSGNHKNIRLWKREQSLEKTRRIRPDLLAKTGNKSK